MMKRLLCAPLLTVGLLMTAALPAKAQEALRPVAVVNDDIISMMDLGQRIALTLASSRQNLTPENQRRIMRPVLRTLVDERLKLQEAERLSITVSENALERMLARVARQFKTTPEQLVKGLSRAGVQRSAILEQFRADLAWARVVNTTLRSSVEIADADIEAVVNRITELGGNTQKRIFEIFLPARTKRQRQEALSIAQEALKNLQEGANFSGLARQLSRSGSAGFGGDLGWVQAGQLPKELQQTVASTPAGSLLGPLTTKEGIYVLSITDQREVSREERVHLARMLVALGPNPSFEAQQAAQAKAEGIRRDVLSCNDVTQQASTLGDDGSGDLGIKTASTLAPEVAALVEDLPLNRPSAISSSAEGLSVYYVCDRKAPEDAIDRLAIKNKLIDDRLNNLAQRHLGELRRSATIDIRL